MTDEELIKATSEARGRAHRAAFAEYSMDHKGRTKIVNHVHSWAPLADAFIVLARDCKERGLEIPACNCPAGAHS